MPRDPYGDTEVPVERSQQDIKNLLQANGVKASRFTYYQTSALVEFVLPGPNKEELSYRIAVDTKRLPPPKKPTQHYLDQRVRQMWRMLYWWLKAKFEAIQFGLVEKETEFLPFMMVRGERGQATTMAGLVMPRIAAGLSDPSDPFGGIMPLPPGRPDKPEGQEK